MVSPPQGWVTVRPTLYGKDGTGSNPVLTTKLKYMATLETQYKNYLLENPDSKFTFDEWKVWLGNQLNEALEDLKKNQKNIR